MTGRPGISRLFSVVAAAAALAGCHAPTARKSPPGDVGPVDVRAGYAAGTLAPSKVEVALKPPQIEEVSREFPPQGVETARGAAPTTTSSAKVKAAALTSKPPPDEDNESQGTAIALRGPPAIGGVRLPRLHAALLIRETDSDAAKLPPVPPSKFERGPSVPLPESGRAVPKTEEPPISPAPGSNPVPPPAPPHTLPTAPARPVPAVPDTPPAELPLPNAAPTPPPSATPPRTLPELPGDPMLPPPTLPANPLPSVEAAPILVGGKPLAFDSLSKLVDGSGCGVGGSSCSTCGGDCGPGRPCPAGGRRCEPFPVSRNPVKKLVGMVYECICCPDPCYQPRWEPVADSAFFVDAPRPTNNTRFRWDYGNHLAYPDRGEYFWARGDGDGKGPTATDPRLRAVPYVDYHELSLVSEIAAGKASVAISVPYRTINATPFGRDALGFADMTITAKTLLADCELFLWSMQMRTYIPMGSPGKGLGVGHMSLEPGMLFGLRLSPDTYLQAMGVEWIPLGGDQDYAGAHLRWGVSLNHVLWRPVKDVQLIGTAEVTGISFQDGLFTDPLLGPQELSGRNIVSLGTGARLFFCDTFDIGVGGNFAVTGKYLAREQLRLEVRFRY